MVLNPTKMLLFNLSVSKVETLAGPSLSPLSHDVRQRGQCHRNAQPHQLGKLVSIGSKAVEFAMTLEGNQEFAYAFEHRNGTNARKP